MSSNHSAANRSPRHRKPRGPRIVRRAIDGVVLLDKPPGISSNDACQRVKRFFRAESAGHTGTLDPFATGLLPVALGEATKFAGGLLEADKTYEARAKLGVRTDTGDLDGLVIDVKPITHSPEALDMVVAKLTGPIEQVPPMYSALKRDGRPLYEYARAGQVVERAPRPVVIQAFDLLDVGADEIHLRVRCSKGTYIRTLIDDLGQMLGCGAHLLTLRRTGIGPLTVESAHPLATLESMDEDALGGLLRAPDTLVGGYQSIDLDEPAARKLLLGQTVRAIGPIGADGVVLRAYGPGGRFLGLVAKLADGRIRPERLIRIVAPQV